jgi:hypothetical protein
MDRVAELIATLRGTATLPARNSFPAPKVVQLGPEAADALEAAQARIVELEQQLAAARGGIGVAWQEAHKMRNASKLVGPYPNDPAASRLWARSLYHAGKDLAAKLKPFRALAQQEARDA